MEPADPPPAPTPAPIAEPGTPAAPLRLPPRTAAGRAANPPAAERDPEFDATVTAGSLDLETAPEAYLRLVANPFLGVLGLLAWLVAGYWIVVRGVAGLLTPIAIVLLLACLALIPGRFQYHCLDCGRTGRLSDWRRHLCRRVAERRLDGQARRFHGPPPSVQVVLWLWVLMGVILLAHALDLWPDPPAPPPDPSPPRLRSLAR